MLTLSKKVVENLGLVLELTDRQTNTVQGLTYEVLPLVPSEPTRRAIRPPASCKYGKFGNKS